MKLYVGQAFSSALLKRSVQTYRASGFNFIEIVAQPGRLPQLKKLAAWVRPKETKDDAAVDDFATSVALDPLCLAEPSKLNQAAMQAAIDYGHKLIEQLKPRWVVLRSGPELRPGPASVARLGRAVEAWRSDTHRIAWEPRGLWEPYQVRSVVKDLGLQRVQEATRFEAEPVSYVRLVELGVQRGARVLTLEGLAERLLVAEEAYVVLEGAGAKGALRLLQDAFSEPVGDEDWDELDEPGEAAELAESEVP